MVRPGVNDRHAGYLSAISRNTLERREHGRLGLMSKRNSESGGLRQGRGSWQSLSALLSRRTFLRRAALVSGGLLASGLGIGGWLAVARHAPPRPQGAKPNIILLTADSLRADHVGAYGYARPTTPNLDRLAAESVLFEYAFAPTSYTGPSLASLHTGKYIMEHFMAYKNGDSLYHHTDPTLAALLQAHGCQTAAFVSNFILERKRSQMDKGFMHYDDTLPEKQEERSEVVASRSAAMTTSAALQWLKTRAKPPFFLWVHYNEPHGPYTPPPPYDTMFLNDSLYLAERRLLELSPEQMAGKLFAKDAREDGTKVTPKLVNYLQRKRGADGKVLWYNPRVADQIALYDGEVRSLDESIHQLLQALKARGLYDTSWLLFSSDHGESLGEGGFYFVHGYRATLELLRVPLLIKPPGKPLPRRISTQVSTVDIMPTLLQALGIERPQGISGQPFLSLLRGEREDGPRHVFSEFGYQYSQIDDQHQLLIGYDGPTSTKMGLKQVKFEFDRIPVSLFAYRRDPLGQRDLAGAEPRAAEARFLDFRSFLKDYFRRAAQAVRVRRPATPETAKSRAILKELGY